ncbi:spore germination protein [Alicyclobacillus fastidiosus]|uniref:Spore germination protein n=1 Tax=Alicyclobacillus fastidiosus TaxID=392011 RepID=A0ABV5AIK2_9BACL|nr:spore germination protein [Alicyclobacillus fastidiosus]WEH10144.1 spore germination protein [Alicyclobacillus fastidiosus]
MSLFGRLKYRKPYVPVHKRQRIEQAQNRTPSARLHDSEFVGNLHHDLGIFEDILGGNADLLIRRFQIQIHKRKIHCGLVYMDGSSSKEELNQILRALMLDIDISTHTKNSLEEIVVDQCLPYVDVDMKYSVMEAANWLLSGNSLLFLDGVVKCIGLSTQAFKERSVTQPETEQVIQGSREGFIESIGTNISLMRKRMRTSNMHVELTQIGEQTATNVVYCYVEGIANEDLVREVRGRLERVETDALYGAGYLEQFIEDNHYSPFPQIQNTERPDKAVAAMLEGRVVILVDGTPFALIVPAVFSQFYQTTEDYDTRFLMASMIRGIRLVALIFSLIFPSLYVSLISFNPEMIPTKFAVAVAGGRAGVPFPAIAEIFGLELIMEILREATIRLPQQIGGALSIVGVLVIGQAAVQAGFVSPITVVIVALTTIGSFATPAYNAAIALRMLRFPLMILAGMFGLYGVMVGLILIANHLNSLESFGVPYLSPVVPGDRYGLRDTIVRMPVWSMKRRPKQLRTNNPQRVRTGEDTKGPKGRPLSETTGVRRSRGGSARETQKD